MDSFRPPVHDPASLLALHAIIGGREGKPSSRVVLPNSVRLAGEFPPAADAGVGMRLERYRCLTRGLPLAPLPDEGDLREIGEGGRRFGEVIDLIAGRVQFARAIGAKRLVLPPILLVGPPGCGKSYVANQIASRLVARPFLYSCAGVNSAVPVKGSPRSFHEAGPGLVIEAVVAAGVANPTIVLDEIDKAGQSDWNGQLYAALLPRLERETSRSLHDDFLMTEVDQSFPTWIATANDTSLLPPVLLSRFEVFRIAAADAGELERLLAGFRRAFAREHEVEASRLPPLGDLSVERLRRQLANKADLRALRRTFDAELIATARLAFKGKRRERANALT